MKSIQEMTDNLLKNGKFDNKGNMIQCKHNNILVKRIQDALKVFKIIPIKTIKGIL